MTSKSNVRRDSIIACIGVGVLLIGAANGSAVAMLATALVALAVIAVIHQQRIGGTAMMAIVAAALVGTTLSIILANR
ncbi:MAG: hypothetical protein O2931_08520 [Planctomycetota bacterium]|nr:hypothetical protein [Planctomycetota bacterium]